MRVTWVSTTIPEAIPKRRAQHDIRRFASDSGKLDQFLDVFGTSPPNCSSMIRQAPRMLFALLRKKPVLWISPLELLGIGSGVIGRRMVAAEQILGDDVDTHIGTLGREDRRDKQFQRRMEFQRAGCLGVLTAKRGHHFRGVTSIDLHKMVYLESRPPPPPLLLATEGRIGLSSARGRQGIWPGEQGERFSPRGSEGVKGWPPKPSIPIIFEVRSGTPRVVVPYEFSRGFGNRH